MVLVLLMLGVQISPVYEKPCWIGMEGPRRPASRFTEWTNLIFLGAHKQDILPCILNRKSPASHPA